MLLSLSSFLPEQDTNKHKGYARMTVHKSTSEIRTLLSNANIDFDSVVNWALNAYLPKIFLSCPFTEEICMKNQCLECNSSKKP
jgi:hypothetical protein